MDFENYAQARDFFCLFAMLLGAGIGCILNKCRKNTTRNFRNWNITAALIFFSGALAAMAAAVIYSNGRILMETSVYPYAGILAALLTAALRFPKQAGFPLIIVSGVFIVWISYGYLRFPVIDDSGRLRITREANGSVHVIPVMAADSANTAGKSFPVLTFQSSGSQVMEFRAFCFAFSRALPLIGGVTRGDIAEISSSSGELLYTDPRFSSKFFPRLYMGADTVLAAKHFFSVMEIPAKLEMRRLRGGEGLTVFFNKTENGINLVFH